MEPIRNDVRSEDRNLSEYDVIARAEKILGPVPEWFVENKKLIEHNRAEAKEANSHHVAELRKILSILGY